MGDFSDEARDVSPSQSGQGPSTGASSAEPLPESVAPTAPHEDGGPDDAARATTDIGERRAQGQSEGAFGPQAGQAAPDEQAATGGAPATIGYQGDGAGDSTGAPAVEARQTAAPVTPYDPQGGYGAAAPQAPARTEAVPVPIGTTAQPLGKRRNPFAVLLLSFITLGIYFLYWYGKINSEIRRHDPRIRVSPALAVLAQFIPIVNLVSGYNTAERVKRLEMVDRMPSQISPVVSVLFMLFFGIGYPIQVQSHLNAQWDHHLLGLDTH